MMTAFRFLPTLAIAGLLFSGCSSADKNDYAVIDGEILDIHDEIMPKLEDVNRYSEEIKSKIAKLDSLQQEGISSNTVAEQRLKANDLLVRLHTADSLMWEWMHGYEADSARALPNDDEVRQYFENEKKRILEVKEKTESSLRDAQQFLEK
ncbi:hypothetical protein GCM10023091_17000 [Ravibacter arvi]|uniref:Viral A-type inclusion protein n=1 Tax=Ravibacter arvi TaxID=2051041 RepID=A0ABP8LWP7_9BACT